MQLEIGSTYQGKVKRITNYGAFIAIQPDAAAPETVTGMVHISEISNRFVHDIHEFVQEGQEVQVKVIGMQDNKISLSMKQTEQPQQQQRTRNQNGDAPHTRSQQPCTTMKSSGWRPLPGTRPRSRQSPSRRCLNCPLKICSASSSRTAKNVSATSSGTLNGKTVPEESKARFWS